MRDLLDALETFRQTKKIMDVKKELNKTPRL